MDTQLLSTFRAVAETGSISRAALRLGYTQSAVSRQIGVLETALGRQMFDRLPRGVALTEAGQALLPHAQAVLQRLEAARLPADTQPRVNLVVTGWNAKSGCVAAGLGVALVPSLAVRGTPGDIALLRLHPQDEGVRQVFAAVRAGRTAAPPVGAFLEELRQVAAGLRPSRR